MARVLLFGEPLALFTATDAGPLDEADAFTLSLAGAELNVAIGLTRLGHDVTYLTRLGDDPLGRHLARGIAAAGIDTGAITFDAHHPTGLMLKGRTAVGDPEIAYHRAGSAFSQLEPTVLDDVDFRDFDLVHLTGIPCALGAGCLATTGVILEKASVAGVPVSFDPNLRPQLWPDEGTMAYTLDVIARACQIVLPGLAEGRLLAGSKGQADDGSPEAVARHFLDAGVETVAIKLGAEGAFVAVGATCRNASDSAVGGATCEDVAESVADGEAHGIASEPMGTEFVALGATCRNTRMSAYVPGFEVPEVVDTVGAGDGFAVGFLSATLEGLSPIEAARRANAIGALQVATLGDNEGLPTREELDRFLG